MPSEESVQIAEAQDLTVSWGAGSALSRTKVTRRTFDIIADYQADTEPEIFAYPPNNRAITVRDLCAECFQIDPTDYPDLLVYMNGIVGLGEDAPLQNILNGAGYMLCAAKVKRPIPGSNATVTLPARFLSSNPDLVFKYLLQAMDDRFGRHIIRYRNLLQLSVRRIPGLQPHVDSLGLKARNGVDSNLIRPALKTGQPESQDMPALNGPTEDDQAAPTDQPSEPGAPENTNAT